MKKFTFRKNNGERYESAPEFDNFDSAKAVIFEFVRSVERDVYIFCGERAWAWVGVVNLPENQAVLDVLAESFHLADKVDQLTITYLNDENHLAEEIDTLLAPIMPENNNVSPNWHKLAQYLIDEYRLTTGQV